MEAVQDTAVSRVAPRAVPAVLRPPRQARTCCSRGACCACCAARSGRRRRPRMSATVTERMEGWIQSGAAPCMASGASVVVTPITRMPAAGSRGADAAGARRGWVAAVRAPQGRPRQACPAATASLWPPPPSPHSCRLPRQASGSHCRQGPLTRRARRLHPRHSILNHHAVGGRHAQLRRRRKEDVWWRPGGGRCGVRCWYRHVARRHGRAAGLA